MSDLLFAVALLLLSITVTYLFCLRPMRQGRCAMVAKRHMSGRSTGSDEAEIRDEEVAPVRANR